MIVDAEDAVCLVSDDDGNYCNNFSNKVLLMPLDIPDLPMCDEHTIMFKDWTYDDTIRELVDIMTNEEGMEYLREIIDDDFED